MGDGQREDDGQQTRRSCCQAVTRCCDLYSVRIRQALCGGDMIRASPHRRYCCKLPHILNVLATRKNLASLIIILLLADAYYFWAYISRKVHFENKALLSLVLCRLLVGLIGMVSIVFRQVSAIRFYLACCPVFVCLSGILLYEEASGDTRCNLKQKTNETDGVDDEPMLHVYCSLAIVSLVLTCPLYFMQIRILMKFLNNHAVDAIDVEDVYDAEQTRGATTLFDTDAYFSFAGHGQSGAVGEIDMCHLKSVAPNAGTPASPRSSTPHMCTLPSSRPTEHARVAVGNYFFGGWG